MNPAKNGSDSRRAASRWTRRPRANALLAERLLPRREATNPSSSAAVRIRCRVDSDTPGLPVRAAETELIDTPAREATSTMVIGPLATCSPCKTDYKFTDTFRHRLGAVEQIQP